jgi:hypothetical protein
MNIATPKTINIYSEAGELSCVAGWAEWCMDGCAFTVTSGQSQ